MTMQDKNNSSFSSFMMGIAVGAIGALILKNHKNDFQTKEFLDNLSEFLKTKLNPEDKDLPSFDATNHPIPPTL